jgi:protein-tyrosine kinase
MTRIEDALKKLQRRSGDVRDIQPALPPPVVHAAPVTSKKRASIGGEKHHVEQENLIRAGLLSPIGEAVPLADEFRRIKRPIIANATKSDRATGPRMNVIMLASAMPHAGKTFCAVNLAVSISLERELNVLLVDADVAKRHISCEFGLENSAGLIDLLLDEQADVSDVLVRTDLNDIQVLPAGRSHAHATELLASDRMAFIVAELASRYPDRIILLDSPPLLMTSEAQALASHVGQIVLVVEAGQTSHQMLAQTIESLDRGKAINIVLNKARHPGIRRGYYGGGYHYEHDNDL